MLPLSRLLDICVDEERIHLGMDVLYHDLKSIEATGLGYLDFIVKTLSEILIDNAIRSCKEGEHMRYEMAFIVC
jgi:hypothetical protein